MRIAVIGGLGFIGSYIVEELLKCGHEVLVLDVRKDEIPVGANLCVVDVTNFDQLARFINGVDVVYHLAGSVLNAARKNQHLAVNLDILGTTNVLEACVRKGVKKIIYASSFYAYDGLPSDLFVNENYRSDIFKTEMFGFVKLVGERLILEYNRRYGLKYVILRFGPVYGPSDRCTCVVYDFIKTGLRGNPLIIWGQGERKNQYTYVKDVAKGSVAALSLENEVVNLVSPESVTIRQMAEVLAKKYGFEVKYDLSKQEGPSMPYMSSKKAIEKLRWNPTKLEEGIDEMISKMKTRDSP